MPSGNATPTLDAGGVANYLAGAAPPSAHRGTGPPAALSGSATMTVDGGAFDGTDGTGDTGVAFADPVVRVQDIARFTLANVVMNTRPIAVAFDVLGAGRLTLSGRNRGGPRARRAGAARRSRAVAGLPQASSGVRRRTPVRCRGSTRAASRRPRAFGPRSILSAA